MKFRILFFACFCLSTCGALKGDAEDIWFRGDLYHFDYPIEATGIVLHASANITSITVENIWCTGSASGFGSIDDATDQGALMDQDFINSTTGYLFKLSAGVYQATNSTSEGGSFAPGDHSVTEFNDVTNAGSGKIVSDGERTAWNIAGSHANSTTFAHNIVLNEILKTSSTIDGASLNVSMDEIDNASTTFALYALADKVGAGTITSTERGNIASAVAHIAGTTNPHGVFFGQVGNASENMSAKMNLSPAVLIATQINVTDVTAAVVRAQTEYASTSIVAATITTPSFETQNAGFTSVFDNGNIGSTFTLVWGKGNKQKVTLTADTIVTFSDPPNVSSLQLIVAQDTTGGYAVWDWQASGNVKWPNGGATPTITATSQSVDIVSFLFDGSDYYSQIGQNFK